jgi:hypothetical protein
MSWVWRDEGTRRGIGLAGINQSYLDAWLTELPSHRAPLRAFVRWAADHGYLSIGLEVPAASSRELRTAMDDVDRLHLVRQLLRERTEDRPARPAGRRVGPAVRPACDPRTFRRSVLIAIRPTPSTSKACRIRRNLA